MAKEQLATNSSLILNNNFKSISSSKYKEIAHECTLLTLTRKTE